MRSRILRGTPCSALLLAGALLLLPCGPGFADDDPPEPIAPDSCADCHDEGAAGTNLMEDIEASIHAGMDCFDCHQDKTTYPHVTTDEFAVRRDGCGMCHSDVADEYVYHGRLKVGENADIPDCVHCHGSHGILPHEDTKSPTYPANLSRTCGQCHQNEELTRKYSILHKKAVDIYEDSVHGRATTHGVPLAATCNDCHSAGGSAHRILSPGAHDSSINFFNIPDTCGKCHQDVTREYREGIHGQLVERGKTDSPVCTTCHGEHGILSPSDAHSPVSKHLVAQATCSPCHDSARLNEKYGLPAGRLASFVDSYHGLKTTAGDPRVANCASCHGVHRILPSTDPTSTVHPSNLQATCGDCHPGISQELAAQPIHGVGGQGLRAPIADVIESLYIVLIAVVIGGMVLHWLIDLARQIRALLRKRPQVVRMTTGEVWQHTILMLTFIVLVISGFSLRFSESWFAKLFFGWEGGFRMRGQVHRVAAILFVIGAIWHLVYIFTSRRGRQFLADMLPKWLDVTQARDRVAFNLGIVPRPPAFGRFSYVEKAEYWALIWGTIVMFVTGVILWFDNWFIHYLPKGALDVALVVHYWEAWLATLAIAVWHLYSTVFSPEVYPMNPAWINGRMPEALYAHEHAGHVDEARAETQRLMKQTVERVEGAGGDESSGADESDHGTPPRHD